MKHHQSVFINMIGFRSGLLTVIGRAPTVNKRAMWKCHCDCGSDITSMGKYLRRGEVKSCGCLNRQEIGGKKKTHGHASGGRLTKTYTTWSGMVQRCMNKKNTAWHKYGGGGITLCKRWLRFENFLADMGEKPPGKSIDRIDTFSGYRPRNCRWATQLEQMRNQRSNRWIKYDGKRFHLAEWARRLGINSTTLINRLAKMPLNRAMTKGRLKAIR